MVELKEEELKEEELIVAELKVVELLVADLGRVAAFSWPVPDDGKAVPTELPTENSVA